MHMKKISIILIIVIVILAVIFCAIFFKPSTENKKVNNNQINTPMTKNMSHIVTIKTNMGEIRFATYDADAPKTVDNFITLTQKGFYDGQSFTGLLTDL